MSRITEKQFDVMVKLMRGKPETATNIAARQVLVHGIKQVAARLEQKSSVTRGAVSNAVRRYQRADKLIREAYQVIAAGVTDAQYRCLVKLMRGAPTSRVNIIARRVLVEGMTTAQAKAGMKVPPGRASISAGINRYRKAHQLVVQAYQADTAAE